MITWSKKRVRPFVCPPVRPVEPWRQGNWADKAMLLDVATIGLLASPARLDEIRDEVDYLADLEMRVKTEGPAEPMLIVFDDHGKFALLEGHHRLIVAGRLGMTHWPVRFEDRGGRLRYGVRVSSLIMFVAKGLKR